MIDTIISRNVISYAWLNICETFLQNSTSIDGIIIMIKNKQIRQKKDFIVLAYVHADKAKKECGLFCLWLSDCLKKKKKKEEKQTQQKIWGRFCQCYFMWREKKF